MPLFERHLRVHRTARFYVLGTPSKRTRDLWVACHGYGQAAAKFAKALEPVAGDARVVIAPEALSRFYLDDPAKQHGSDSPVGASWMTREDRGREISDYVEYLDNVTATVRREIGKGEVRITALGFSQGVATVCRWAALGHTEIHRMILWAGTLPLDLPTDRGVQLFHGASVVLVAGKRDTIVPLTSAEAGQQALSDRGLQADVVVFDGGHSLNSETLRQLAASGQQGQ